MNHMARWETLAKATGQTGLSAFSFKVCTNHHRDFAQSEKLALSSFKWISVNGLINVSFITVANGRGRGRGRQGELNPLCLHNIWGGNSQIQLVRCLLIQLQLLARSREPEKLEFQWEGGDSENSSLMVGKATRHQVCLEDGVKVNKALIWSTPAFCWENLPWTVRPQKYLQELKVNTKAQWSAQRATSGPESGNNLNPTVIGFKSLGCWKEGTPFRVIYLYDLCSFWRNGEWNGKSATGCSVIHSSAATLPKALSSRTLLNVQSMKKRTISHCPLPNPLRLFVVRLQLAKWQLCISPTPPPWISSLLFTEHLAESTGLDWM